MSIAAKTGRRMQISASFCKYALPRHADRRSGGEVAGVDHHRLAGGDTLEDLHPVARAPTGPDPLLHGAVALHHEDLLEAGEGRDRRGGHEDGRATGLDDDLGAREGPGPEPALAVRHRGLHGQGTALLLDGGTHAGNPARV